MTMSTLKKSVYAAVAGSTILATAACGGESSDDSSESSQTTATAPSDGAGGEEEGGAAAGSYTAGDYSAEGSYQNPSGTSSVAVDVSLEGDGTITAVTVEPQASGTSLQYQQKFAGGIEAEVVGKKIDELDVSKVSGSSLTSGGFNEAIEAIKADAGV